MKRSIIISFQGRDGLSQARRLDDFLTHRFGESTVAVGAGSLIRVGDDYIYAIEEGVKSSQALLVLIGENWVGEWVNDADNYERIAILSALNSGKRIIPIIVNNGSMPVASTLGDLAPLARRGHITITDDTFRETAARIADATGVQSFVNTTLVTTIENGAKTLPIAPERGAFTASNGSTPAKNRTLSGGLITAIITFLVVCVAAMGGLFAHFQQLLRDYPNITALLLVTIVAGAVISLTYFLCLGMATAKLPTGRSRYILIAGWFVCFSIPVFLVGLWLIDLNSLYR